MARMETSCAIRPATDADLAAVTAIFNDVIATSTAVYYFDATSLAERTAWFETRRAAGFPVLVAERDGCGAGLFFVRRVPRRLARISLFGRALGARARRLPRAGHRAAPRGDAVSAR